MHAKKESIMEMAKKLAFVLSMHASKEISMLRVLLGAWEIHRPHFLNIQTSLVNNNVLVC